MSIYTVYLTVYSGNKLPPFYIGSSSMEKIKNGYHGSVKSRKYKKIWEEELKNNPHLFKTKIVSTHNTRKDALSKEYDIQKKLNVVKSLMYINMSLASINGFFGMSQKGMQGRPCSEESKQKISSANKGKKSRLGKQHSKESKIKMRNAKLGKPLDREHIENMRKASKGVPKPWISEHNKNRTGEKNPNYDYKIYNFIHKSGEIFSGTRHNFYTTYNLDKTNVSAVIRGVAKSVKGWSIVNPD